MKTEDEKLTVKASVVAVFTFEESGHLTMKDLRAKVKDLLNYDNCSVKNIKINIVEDNSKQWEEVESK